MKRMEGSFAAPELQWVNRILHPQTPRAPTSSTRPGCCPQSPRRGRRGTSSAWHREMLADAVPARPAGRRPPRKSGVTVSNCTLTCCFQSVISSPFFRTTRFQGYIVFFTLSSQGSPIFNRNFFLCIPFGKQRGKLGDERRAAGTRLPGMDAAPGIKGTIDAR